MKNLLIAVMLCALMASTVLVTVTSAAADTDSRAVQEAVELIKQASSASWETVMRQQYISRFANMVLCGILAVMLIVYLRLFPTLIGRFTSEPIAPVDTNDRAANQRYEQELRNHADFCRVVGKYIPLGLLGFVSIVFVANIWHLMIFLLNPEYYGLREILQLVK